MSTQINPTSETLRSFGRCAAGTSLVYRPATCDEVIDVFAIARREKRRIAIRGGGHSFDEQAVHDGDTGSHIILSTDGFKMIRFEAGSNTVQLGAGVTWGDFVDATIARARTDGQPILLPGSMQTGRHATVGGTLSGDCLSRFSGTAGKESRWIESFRILTPSGQSLDVSARNNPELFNAVIGGHGYIGFVTDATYKLLPIDAGSCARTTITRHTSLRELVDKQLALIHEHKSRNSSLPLAVSAAWFRPLIDPPPLSIKGGVFSSSYAAPSTPPLAGFPLYDDIESEWRYFIELMARPEITNAAIHEMMFQIAAEHGGVFENDLRNFLFFMDGNTVAKDKFEARHKPQLFPIVQQTFVVSPERAEAFAATCEARMSLRVRATECDMLYVEQDDCLMSASSQGDGFAITLGFEPIAPGGCGPKEIADLLRTLSKDCADEHGRIHLVKNVYADKSVLQRMFSPQIERFEQIKRTYDPDLLLQNTFSDKIFEFSLRSGA